jgi:DNA-binding response OmpR family regulator
MHDWQRRAEVLDAENETLRDRVRDLEKEIGLAAEAPPMFGLTRSEALMFGVLLNNRTCQVSTFMTALFSLEIDDPPEEKILDVWVCKMRKKLTPYGIEIKTHWGVGYEMPEESKARARELMAET